MRKLKRRKKNNFTYMIALYIIMLVSISTAYSFLNTDLSLKGTSGFAKSASYNYSYKYTLDSKWGTYTYQISSTVTYLGQNDITSWKAYVFVPLASVVNGCYDALSCTINGNVMTVTSPTSYNHNLSPNSTLIFSFQLTTNSPTYFEEYRIIGMNFYSGSIIIDPNPGAELDFVSHTLSITGGSGKVTNYEYVVTNNSDILSLSHWEVPITFPTFSKLSNFYGGTYTYDKKIGIITISNPSSPITLGPKQTTTVTFSMDVGVPTGYMPTVGTFSGTVISG
jgi:hypothetical protein